MIPRRTRRTAPGRVIELVGPAGAGKSTLARVLPAGDPRIALSAGVWFLPRLALAISAVRLIPTVLTALFGGTPLRGSEIAQMIRIDALHRVMARARAGGSAVIVMDEGPVFALAWLEVFFGRNGDPGYGAWRRRAMRAWARELDGVVRLDADDAVLARRINERIKDHMVKGAPPSDIADFTARFRRAFDRTLGELGPAGVRVVPLRTDEGAIAERVERLHSAIREVTRGC